MSSSDRTEQNHKLSNLYFFSFSNCKTYTLNRNVKLVFTQPNFKFEKSDMLLKIVFNKKRIFAIFDICDNQNTTKFKCAMNIICL